MYRKRYFVSAVLLLGTVLLTAQTPTIKGNVFGGGRMASVGTQAPGTTTATVTVNASTIQGGVYGGNDITGTVSQGTTASAGVTINNVAVSVNEVYGGGNGYYQYRLPSGTVLKPGDVTQANASTAIAQGTSVKVFNVGESDYSDANTIATFTAPSGCTYSTLMPVVDKTSVSVGSATGASGIDIADVYGGAKNAKVSSSSCTVKSGTIERVFAGNNVGGSIGTTSLQILGTNTASGTPDWTNAGKGFGIGEAYGGGNAVSVSGSTEIDVQAGQVGKAFGGNNLADMYIVPSVYIKGGTIDIVYGGGNAGNMKGVDYGTIDYSKYISNLSLPTAPTKMENQILPLFAGTDVMIDNTAAGSAGATVNSVYGGCRAANVDNSTYIRLTKGTVGNLFGGCDIAGSVGFAPGTLSEAVTFRTYLGGDAWADVKYSDGTTVFKLGDKSNNKDMVYASTYLKINGGTVGNVYGSGNGNYSYSASGNTVTVKNLAGTTTLATFDNSRHGEPFVTSARVCIEGGSVTGNIYGGGLNATLGHVITQTDINNADAAHKSGTKYKMYGKEYAVGDIVSRTSYLFLGTGTAMTIPGNIFGGGCLANVYGTMDIIVKANTTLSGALYAGNDASGSVMGTGRGDIQATAGESGVTYGTMLMDPSRDTTGLKPWESYGGTTLTHDNAQTYVRVEEGAVIANLYGGSNGDYTYGNPSGGKVEIKTKGSSPTTIGYAVATTKEAAHPIQASTWVDAAGTITSAYGGGNAANIGISNLFIARNAKIQNAYGGGNSATVTEKANIWVDCNAALTNATASDYNVQTLFGGNNLAAMDILPTIYLWCGKIGTVYGGGNAGDMRGHDAFALDYTAYKDNTCLTEGVVKSIDNVKWLPMFAATEVLVDSPYKLPTKDTPSSKERLQTNPTPTDLELQSGLRINAVYGGCKAANIDNSTYTRITRADYVGAVYGGNDIAGTVGMKPGTYTSGTKFVVYKVDKTNGDQTRAELGTLDFTAGKLMTNSGSYVCVTGGVMPGNVFGGGNGEAYTDTYSSLGRPFSSATLVMLEGGTVNGNVFGGGNQADVKYSLMSGGTANTTPTDAYKAANPFCNNSHIFIGETSRRKSDVVLTNVFGGGNQAGVAGNTHVDIDGSTISGAVYGGCNSSGTVAGNSKVTLHKGTIGASGTGTANNNVLFGGGLGSGTSVTNDVFVTVNGGTINGTIYGGGSQGIVNTNCDNVTSTTVKGGIITGDIYGGALQANINGQIQMNVTGGTFRSIFAANNQGGLPKCDIALNYSADGDCESAIYGGGNEADFTGNTQVVFNKGRIGYIYGGANMANVTGNTYVYILGGEICHDVFGGGKGVAGEDNGNVSGSTNVYVLDDRLDASGNYVISKDASGNTKTASAGPVLTIGSGAEQNFPEQPKGWTESMRSSINIKGNIYGGGSNGNVGGKTNVVIGSGK